MLPFGWRSKSLRQYSSKPAGLVLTSSGEVVSPCTSTAGGSARPLAVGSEKSSDTLGSRRTFSAFCFSPTDVVITNRPSSGRHRATTGQAIGVPSRASVENSQVRNSCNTPSTSRGSASLPGRDSPPSPPASAEGRAPISGPPRFLLVSFAPTELLLSRGSLYGLKSGCSNERGPSTLPKHFTHTRSRHGCMRYTSPSTALRGSATMVEYRGEKAVEASHRENRGRRSRGRRPARRRRASG